ncbi:integrase catalytic domain-containing protein [Nephila pilipes]|uniref:Integrase catalytic domain-containing protein n=1 Tax=Nephila pilipes TaxID=299642 RepID=A0A8X6IUZ7_NEPPI|nr:integrase catalytic domain-containing protein [Nephila pilipes]
MFHSGISAILTKIRDKYWIIKDRQSFKSALSPLYVKNNEDNHFFLILTRAPTRAIHLEFVNYVTADTFLLTLRKLASRIGIPAVIYSDNAKTFERSNLDLKTIWSLIKHLFVIRHLP